MTEQFDSERDGQAWLRWGSVDWRWRHWLRQSPRAIALFDWLNDADKYRVMVGSDGYRQHVLELLATAVPEDCAAAGMDCDGSVARVVSELLEIRVEFSPAGSHRAVTWRDAAWPAARAWVDGAAIVSASAAQPAETDMLGRWADERYYCIAIAGPRDHPRQDFADFDRYLGRIRSLLIWDALNRTPHSVQTPQPSENWTAPAGTVREGALHIHGHARAAASAPTDRIVAL